MTFRDTFSSLDFTYWVQLQIGDRYNEFADLSNAATDPNEFSMSELVRWASSQVGVFMPKGADQQIEYAESKNRLIPVEDGLTLRGAVLWYPSFIVISLGMGRTIEAVDGRVGLVRNASAGRFSKAAKIPGVRY